MVSVPLALITLLNHFQVVKFQTVNSHFSLHALKLRISVNTQKYLANSRFKFISNFVTFGQQYH